MSKTEEERKKIDRDRHRESYKINSEKILARHKKWRLANPEQYKENYKGWLKKSHLKRTYGLSTDDYNAIFDMQDGRCAICGNHQSQFKRALFVDHDHESGQVRGLICMSCNFILGFAKDQTNILEAAIKYLVDWKKP